MLTISDPETGTVMLLFESAEERIGVANQLLNSPPQKLHYVQAPVDVPDDKVKDFVYTIIEKLK